jgi:hypothetical protein
VQIQPREGAPQRATEPSLFLLDAQQGEQGGMERPRPDAPRWKEPTPCKYGGFITTGVCLKFCRTVTRPMTCGQADCARPACRLHYLKRRMRGFLDHLRVLGSPDLVQVVATMPSELWDLVSAEDAANLRAELIEILRGVLARRAGLAVDERPFLAGLLHPSGDSAPHRWSPHIHAYIAGTVLTGSGSLRPLDLHVLEGAKKEIEREWREALARATRTVPRPPQVHIKIHAHREVYFVLERELRAISGWHLGRAQHLAYYGAWSNGSWGRVRQLLGWKEPRRHTPGICDDCGSHMLDFPVLPREVRQAALDAFGRSHFSSEETQFHDTAAATGLDDFAQVPEVVPGDRDDLVLVLETGEEVPDSALPVPPHVKGDGWSLTLDLRGVPLYDPSPAGHFAHVVQARAAERSSFAARALARDVQMVCHLARVPRWGDAASALLATARAELRDLRARALTEARRTRRLAAFRAADLLDAVLGEDFGSALSAQPVAGLGYYLPSATLRQIRTPLAELVRRVRAAGRPDVPAAAVSEEIG